MSEKVKYILEEYSKLGICNDNNDWFNPFIYPDTDTSIPVCSVCQEDYTINKRSDDHEEAVMRHTDSCLWYNWFVAKMKLYNPRIKIVRQKKKQQKDKQTKKMDINFYSGGVYSCKEGVVTKL